MASSGRDRWLAWRNRLFADVRFQRWAADFPLTRAIARRRTQDLFDLVAGFVYSQTLGVCVQLGLFDRLADGPMTTAELAKAFALPLGATERLLGAAHALGLVEPAGPARYALGAQGAALRGAPGLMQMIRHHARLYADLSDGEGLLRRGSGELARYWPYATAERPRSAEAPEVADYSALMAATLPAVAADLMHAYPFVRHRKVMDVGGGEGAFLEIAGARARALELVLFDLPAVTERARARLGRAAMLERATFHAGDFLADPLPHGADLVTLIRILHDQDDTGVSVLLRAVRAALPLNGTLLIAEPMSGGARPERVADAYFAFYLLAMGRGRARSPAELASLLQSAGFSRVRHLRTRTPALLQAIAARP